MAVFKDCHETSPKVVLKWGLCLKTVLKHRPKLYWSDGCLQRLSSNIPQSYTEVMAVFKDCHQTSPKVILKWWLSLKIVIKHCPKFFWSDSCLKRLLIKGCPKFCWSDGCLWRLSSKTAESSAEVMAVWKTKDCWKFCWSDGCLKDWRKDCWEKIANQNRLKKS